MSYRNLRERKHTVSYKESSRNTSAKIGVAKPASTKQPPTSQPTARVSISGQKSNRLSSVTKSQVPSPNQRSSGVRTSILNKPVITTSVPSVQVDNSSTQLLKEEVSRIATKLVEIETWCRQLKSDNESLQFVTAELCQLEVRYAETTEVCNELRAENEDLRKSVFNLKAELQQLKEVTILRSEAKQFPIQTSTSSDTTHVLVSEEQQEINNNIVIRGFEFPETGEKQPLEAYESIRTLLGIQQNENFNPLSASVLTPGTANHTAAKTIQVRLRTIAAKRQFLQIRRTRKDITQADLGLGQNQNKAILITEQLTRNNQELLYAARSLRHTHKYKFVWSNNGQILVRPQQNAKVIRITDIGQVNDLRAQLHIEPLILNRHGRPTASLNIVPSSSDP